MNQLEARTQTWIRDEGVILRIFGVVIFAFLTVLSAQIRIPLPFTPVPMTLQTFVVPLAGGILGGTYGAISMLLYLFLGAVGFGTFASAGPAFFLAPTAGYLLAFPIAAALVGWMTEHFRKNWAVLVALILSHFVILTSGMIGLILNAGFPADQAFYKGVAPFLVGDLFKIVASFLVLFSFHQFVGRKNPGVR